MTTEYLIAWAVYYAAAACCLLVWWRMTSFMSAGSYRDLARGVMTVILLTPWYAGDSPEFYAPAIMVLGMDLLLEGTESGLKGGIALLVATFLMLVVLLVLRLRRGRG